MFTDLMSLLWERCFFDAIRRYASQKSRL